MTDALIAIWPVQESLHRQALHTRAGRKGGKRIKSLDPEEEEKLQAAEEERAM